MKELNTIYKFLIEHQLTTSQEDFSKHWLHKSPRYYATIKSSKRNASVEALSTLMVKLYGLGDELHANKHGDKAVLCTPLHSSRISFEKQSHKHRYSVNRTNVLLLSTIIRAHLKCCWIRLQSGR
ncbi:DUF6626 family protein [Magnetovibrio blakemorei]|uniref:Uncharacterized protein n=1 Tax=Magnetovibrio blakemorei TaxID=28181 RepID=A0A1E5Q4L8_9PROT|nr:DUF6626 family protein [Magnetovibrio blakemorei]OEJ64810.1 hypothetical protein BEN30_15985 [Magnetovibrio blakemorei]